jgi:hypothetical protein
MAERFVLFQPEQQVYHCGGFLDADWRRAYLYHSVQFARQGLMASLVDVGNKKSWVIQRVDADWDSFGDLVSLHVQEEIRPFGA